MVVAAECVALLPGGRCSQSNSQQIRFSRPLTQCGSSCCERVGAYFAFTGPPGKDGTGGIEAEVIRAKAAEAVLDAAAAAETNRAIGVEGTLNGNTNTVAANLAAAGARVAADMSPTVLGGGVGLQVPHSTPPLCSATEKWRARAPLRDV